MADNSKTEKMDDIYKKLSKLKTLPDNDNIKYKEIIKLRLINNPYIIHVLNNTNLDEDSPSDYFGVNILPFYTINPVQTDVQNYITFDTLFSEEVKYNDLLRYGQIRFNIMCDFHNIMCPNGLSRTDVLASLIINQFNWSSEFGTKIHLVNESPNTVDNLYVTRMLVFQQETPTSIVKSDIENGTYSRIVNTDNWGL